MLDGGEPVSDPVTGQEYEKYAFTIHRCARCQSRINKNLIDQSQCPICKSPLVVQVITRTVLKRKWRMLRPNWFLGHNHPDYDYSGGYWKPPKVNLICLRCKAIFQNVVLNEDKQIWRATHQNGGTIERNFNSKLYSNTACPDEDTVIYGTERQLVREKCEHCDSQGKRYDNKICMWADCPDCGGTGIIGVVKRWVPIHSGMVRSSHDLRVLHRLVTVKSTSTRNKHSVTYEISSDISVELCLNEIKVAIYEGGSGIVVDEGGVAVRTTGTCFIPPPGFEPNPVEEMDEETLNEVFAGLVAKNQEKAEKRKQGILKSDKPPEWKEV